MADDFQLAGDPRKLAEAIFRAALTSDQDKNGKSDDQNAVFSRVQSQIPELAQQMADALEGEARDVYLMNALELMAIDCARRGLT